MCENGDTVEVSYEPFARNQAIPWDERGRIGAADEGRFERCSPCRERSTVCVPTIPEGSRSCAWRVRDRDLRPDGLPAEITSPKTAWNTVAHPRIVRKWSSSTG